jgi:hypothetical protein
MADPFRAEELIAHELGIALESVKTWLHPFGQNPRTTEFLLLLSAGVLLGAYSVNEVCDRLGLSPQQAYAAVRFQSVYRWRKVLGELGYEMAIPLLQELQGKSAATQSRACCVLAVDDSVLERLSREMGLVWAWYSGRRKRVVRGQDILGLVLVIGEVVIPLDIRIVSKQGRVTPTKPEIYAQMLEHAQARFQQAGLDLRDLATSGDSAFLSEHVQAKCQDLKVAGVFGGKDSYVFTIEGETHKAKHWRPHFADRLEKDRWGCEVPVYRTPAVSPTFGKVILVFCRRKGARTVSYFILTQPLRTAEALRIIHQHHWIEVFWKRCKGLFKLANSKLRTPQGARAGVGIKVVGYLLLLRLQIALKRYRRFARISMDRLVKLCQQFFDPIPVFQEHFHLLPIDNISIDQYLRAS